MGRITGIPDAFFNGKALAISWLPEAQNHPSDWSVTMDHPRGGSSWGRSCGILFRHSDIAMENIPFFVAINIHVVILRIFVKSPEGRFDCDLDLYKANVFASILMFG